MQQPITKAWKDTTNSVNPNVLDLLPNIQEFMAGPFAACQAEYSRLMDFIVTPFTQPTNPCVDCNFIAGHDSLVGFGGL